MTPDGLRARPRTDAELRKLIGEMHEANPPWGAPRIHGELLKLGIEISQRAVGRLMGRKHGPPNQPWRTSLDNHVRELASSNSLAVPTTGFRVLGVLVVLRHERRRIVHVNVTVHEAAEWTAQPVIDAIHGEACTKRVKGRGIEQVKSEPRARRQGPCVERVTGPLRRELTPHVIVLDERHLLQLIREYVAHDNATRMHVTLEKDSPMGREVQGPGAGQVVALPQVGGLHHRSERRAA